MKDDLPPHVLADLARAERLEWWTLAWMTSVIAAMATVVGSSAAMRTALVEDVLSQVPAAVFLIARRIERRPESPRFPFGFDRVNSLAFLISAVALASVGATLLLESTITLAKREHVTVAPVEIFGTSVWLGWPMIAALAYSVVPPVILGRMKLPVARRLQDKVLHTDALMQRADWQTGLAGIAGIFGIGLGLWWADAAAAALIALSILHDGVNALRLSTAELIDGAPRGLDSSDIDPEAAMLQGALEGQFPGAVVRLRETGRFIHAQIDGVPEPEAIDRAALWPGAPERAWRLGRLSFIAP